MFHLTGSYSTDHGGKCVKNECWSVIRANTWDHDSAECASTNSCAHVTLTLNNVGDHQGGAGVVANETTTGQVVFNLQGKQVPGERKTEGTMEKSGW